MYDRSVPDGGFPCGTRESRDGHGQEVVRARLLAIPHVIREKKEAALGHPGGRLQVEV